MYDNDTLIPNISEPMFVIFVFDFLKLIIGVEPWLVGRELQETRRRPFLLRNKSLKITATKSWRRSRDDARVVFSSGTQQNHDKSFVTLMSRFSSGTNLTRLQRKNDNKVVTTRASFSPPEHIKNMTRVLWRWCHVPAPQQRWQEFCYNKVVTSRASFSPPEQRV